MISLVFFNTADWLSMKVQLALSKKLQLSALFIKLQLTHRVPPPLPLPLREGRQVEII